MMIEVDTDEISLRGPLPVIYFLRNRLIHLKTTITFFISIGNEQYIEEKLESPVHMITSSTL